MILQTTKRKQRVTQKQNKTKQNNKEVEKLNTLTECTEGDIGCWRRIEFQLRGTPHLIQYSFIDSDVPAESG